MPIIQRSPTIRALRDEPHLDHLRARVLGRRWQKFRKSFSSFTTAAHALRAPSIGSPFETVKVAPDLCYMTLEAVRSGGTGADGKYARFSSAEPMSAGGSSFSERPLSPFGRACAQPQLRPHYSTGPAVQHSLAASAHGLHDMRDRR